MRMTNGVCVLVLQMYHISALFQQAQMLAVFSVLLADTAIHSVQARARKNCFSLHSLSTAIATAPTTVAISLFLIGFTAVINYQEYLD